jgi:hypothetical protein
MIEDSSNDNILKFSAKAQIRSINGRKNKQDNSLKGLGHEIRIVLKWYGLIGLGKEKVRQIFISFLTVPLILY